MKQMKMFLVLHIFLILYSASSICSKLAGSYSLFSLQFFIFYGVAILLLGLYAVGWQQIIKRIPLTVAFANKSVTVVWGLIWSVLFFGERITWIKLVGVVCVVVGVVIFVTADREKVKGQ